MEGFQWNLPHTITIRVRIAENVSKVRCRRSRWQRGQMHSSCWDKTINSLPSIHYPWSGGIPTDSVASRLTCSSNQKCEVGVPSSPESRFWRGLGVWLRARSTPWLYTEPGTTRFWPVYSSYRSCYLKHVLSSCHFVVAHIVGAVVRGNSDEYLSMTVWHAVITPSAH